MSGFLTSFVGAIVEAWDELRVHKVRVLLALVGVAAAVCAITGVTAVVSMLGQAMQEQNDAMMGRKTTLEAWIDGGGGDGASDPQATDGLVDSVAARYDISYYSVDSWVNLRADMPGGDKAIDEVRAVDVDHATIMRLQVEEGRWFAEADIERLAPVLVVNQPFLDQFANSASVTERPTVTLVGETPVTGEVIGVVPKMWEQEGPRAYVLHDQIARWDPAVLTAGGYKFWVPDGIAEPLADRLGRDLRAAGLQADVMVPPQEAFQIDRAMKYATYGIGGFALLLGGLGLVNIALVSVRYRIREIGIRRSFGATGSRVFFGVMMESVVATFIAGLVGVVIAVAVVKNIPVEAVLGSRLQDKPGFPFSAAMVGMACAIGVGAIAGLVPAIYAVRVKVIDAIRY